MVECRDGYTFPQVPIHYSYYKTPHIIYYTFIIYQSMQNISRYYVLKM